MTNEFCSIFIRKTVKQGRALNTWLVQTKFNKEGRKEVVVSVVVVFVFFVLVLVLVLVLVIIHILL